MRALLVESFGDPESLQVRELEAPSAGAGELVVRMAGVGVGYFDGLMAKGEYQIRPPLPFVPGTSLAGIVEQVGSGVSGFAVGDAVAGFTLVGALAEKVRLPATACFRLPSEVPLETAANFLVSYATAVYGLREIGRLAPGETLMVYGASGSTGSTAIEVGKALGARVFACASTEEKRAACLALGADEAIDPDAPDARERVKAFARRGIDLVFDPVGGPRSEQGVRSLAPGGRLLVVGFVAGIAKVPTNLLLLKRCSMAGVNWGGALMDDPGVVAPVMETLVQLTLAGKLRAKPDRVLPLARAGEAFGELFARRSVGTVVITP